jgi:hypothetical protein
VKRRAITKARARFDRLVARGARPRSIARAERAWRWRKYSEEDRLKRIAKRERALSVQEFVEAVGSGAVATLPPDATVQIVGGSP